METRKAWNPINGVVKVSLDQIDSFGRIKGINQKGDQYYTGPAIGEPGFKYPIPVK